MRRWSIGEAAIGKAGAHHGRTDDTLYFHGKMKGYGKGNGFQDQDMKGKDENQHVQQGRGVCNDMGPRRKPKEKALSQVSAVQERVHGDFEVGRMFQRDGLCVECRSGRPIGTWS